MTIQSFQTDIVQRPGPAIDMKQRLSAFKVFRAALTPDDPLPEQIKKPDLVTMKPVNVKLVQTTTPKKKKKKKKRKKRKRKRKKKVKKTQAPPAEPDYEPGYPVRNTVNDFKTQAVAEEIHKHDRLVVDGMAYMRDLSMEDMEKFRPKPEQIHKRKLCINIAACNRRIPYIDTAMMTLMTGQSPERLNTYAQVNLLNTERRREYMHFDRMRNHLAKLPFVEIYNFSAIDEPHAEYSFRVQFLLDIIHGLKICLESGLKWCLMMEEDAVFPRNFIDDLDKFVIQPMETKRDEISVISLYAYYNQVWLGPKRLVLPEYSRYDYKTDRAMGNMERKSKNLPRYSPFFQVKPVDYPYGTVALLYPIETVEKLIPYLEKQSKKPTTDADVMINKNINFPAFMEKPRLQVEPSLINHIGFYSRRMKDVTKRGIFAQLNTDARFQQDAQDEIEVHVSRLRPK